MLLHVYEWGDPGGEPLVCLHGVTGYAGVYQRLAEERWRKRRVLAFDLRGHGRSGWEPPWTFATHVADLTETATALGLSTADWVGHSFGGRLILELASVSRNSCDELAYWILRSSCSPRSRSTLQISSGASPYTGARRITSKNGC
jgi:Predicted hydrolases or acyltransferases (alpha/beta hydrolase superfamily)